LALQPKSGRTPGRATGILLGAAIGSEDCFGWSATAWGQARQEAIRGDWNGARPAGTRLQLAEPRGSL